MKKFFATALILLTIIYFASADKIFVTAEVDGAEEIVTEVKPKVYGIATKSFIHSVQKTPVIEELEFDGEKFILRRTKYKSHGVGLPFMESDGDFHELDGRFIMDNMNRPIKNLSLRTGVGTQLTIKLGGTEFKLYEKFPVGTRIDFKIGSTFKNFIGRNF